ncbi:23S rRNA (guanosine-2'-O-)-methyltransferase RlmB [endosymbiont of Euscepes postfasciatus]|uniref:RNA methyltransferase n=1 Tax=endosymbiont of Euscepes postfasciatus TaxID=650377 RepID=UPI000DC71F21|nr:RNA methyltransferase [endosymbiont of Euscepes postfasciatus]BBA84590.1 23S rRNA (guanosine-2'-O-)-methyltransferase RlmB [endosymbiont of Euscepes postfasciatus]
MNNIVYGFHNINYFLNVKKELIDIFFLYKNINIKENLKLKVILNKINYLNIPIKFVNKKYITNLIGEKLKKNNQNFCIKIKNNISYSFDKIKLLNFINNNNNKKLFIILENIKDSRNLGSCIRNADAAGINIVLITKKNSSSLNNYGTNISSSGAINNLNIMKFNDIKYILNIFKKNKIKIVSTSDKSNNIIYNNNLKLPIVYIFGSEDKGITEISKKYSDLIVKIPTYGYINSINVSVAVGICLFESIRQTFFINKF